ETWIARAANAGLLPSVPRIRRGRIRYVAPSVTRWLSDEQEARLRATGRLRDVNAKIAREWNGNVEPVVTKFRNVKTNGYASKKEAARAESLHVMAAAGRIRNLREQVEYELIPKQEGERACFYRADFVYDEFGADGWRQVVEDTKGVKTPDYIIKRKLMLNVH